MEQLQLVKPDATFSNDIEAYRAEMLAAGSSLDGTGPLRRMETAAEWLAFNRQLEQETDLPPNMVAADQFVYVREPDHKIVGMIQFRHTLNDYLLQFGGHIGYSVRVSERRKGYAKRMLADCLQYCRAFGLEKALITCKVENEGSRRTILANGGVYENTVFYETDNVYLERYWVTL